MASEPSSSAGRIRFGDFEVDLRSHELLRSGRRLRLQEKSFLVLQELLRSPGQVVTREELAAALWPKEYFVDVEHGLNTAVRRLREALGDSAEEPRFVETLPRLGYRFIGAIEMPADADARPDSPAPSSSPPLAAASDPPETAQIEPAPPPPSPVATPEPQERSHRGRVRVAAALLVAAALALVVVLGARSRWAGTAAAPASPAATATGVQELLARAYYLQNMKRFGDSKKFLEEALKLDPDNGTALGRLAVALVAEKRFDQARETARRAIELDPEASEAHRILGSLARFSGNLALAERHFRRAVEADPENGKTRNRLARQLLEVGKLEEARGHMLESKRLDPDNPDVQNIWLDYWLRAGDYEKAIREGESWLVIWPDQMPEASTLSVRDALGLAYVGARRHEDALAQFRAIDPADELRVALALGYAGRTAEARAILEAHETGAADALAATPPSPGRDGALAMAWVATGDLDRAFEHIDRQVAAHRFPGWLNCALFAAVRADPRYAALALRLEREFFGDEERELLDPQHDLAEYWPRPARRAPRPAD